MDRVLPPSIFCGSFFPYSIKLFRVGTVSMFVSKLDPDNQGVLEQNELRKESINNAVNITDDR